MTRPEIAARARDLIATHLDIDPAKVTEGARFIEDLGCDSLDNVELVMAGEEEFDIEIPDDDAEVLATFGQAVDYLAKRLGAAVVA